MNNASIVLAVSGLAGLAAIGLNSAPQLSGEPACKARVKVEIRTAADKDQQGRIVISEWKQAVEKQHGPPWTNFKIAAEPVVKCRNVGNEAVATCFAEGNPCKG